MGFFSKAEIAVQAKQEVDVEQLRSHCAKCKLDKNCKTPRMEVSGLGQKNILIVGDAPSDTDDNNAIQFSGESGEYLNTVLRKEGISLNKDCFKVNAVRCSNDIHPEKLSNAAKLCSGYIEKIIYEKKPELVLILGSAGIATVFPEFKNRLVNRWRDLLIPDEKYNTNFFITFHPREVLINKYDNNLKYTFERDIKSAFSKHRNNQIIRDDAQKKIKVLTDYKSVLDLLNRILDREEFIYFDYETTGLKPFRPGHKIACIGVAFDSNSGYAFPFDFNSFWSAKELAEIKRLWLEILKSPKIKKSIQNYKFEDNWSSIIIGSRVINTVWDTMMASHIRDNRTYFSGLKFQTFINYGVRPYDEHIKSFLDSKGKEFNTVMKAPLRELLLYCGLDCLYGIRLYEKQKSYLSGRKGLLSANSFFTRGLAVMSYIQLNGIRMNEKYYSDQRQKLAYRVNKLRRGLMKGREAISFKEKYRRPLDINSNMDLGKLFYEVLGAPVRKTANDNYKTDADTLGTLNLPFVDKLLKMKRFEKARGTYLGQFAREVYDGMLHPFFDLHIPVSYRSCLSKDAKIKTLRSNSYFDIAISNIVKGDIVFCLNEKQEIVTRKVIWQGITGYRHLVRLWFEDSPHSKLFVDCTIEHKIKSKGNKYIDSEGYTEVQNLLPDDIIICTDDKFNIKEYKFKKLEFLNIREYVYDLEVEEYPNFFANNVCVHNSSSNPNFQNLPKRNLEIMRIIRRGIIPRINRVLSEIDFSGSEVVTSACYHKDRNFLAYLRDKTTDMHRDQALKLWMLDREELENPDFTADQKKKAKDIRFYAKNDWTFAQFYGDWYDSCGRTLWSDSIEQQKLILPSGVPLYEHIKSKGIYEVEDFVEHCKVCEDDLWNKRFPEYTQWKKDIVKY